MKTLAPIAIFAYNRPEHLSKCIDSLKRNSVATQTKLFLFSDGPKNNKDVEKIKQVRSKLSKVCGFEHVELICEERNKGLARSIIDGVNLILENSNEIIVLEDDLIVSNDFIEYMNAALDFYREKQKVFSISAYTAPIRVKPSATNSFFFQRINSWGWATWKDRWDSVDWGVEDFDNFMRNKQEIKGFNQGGEDLSAMLLKQKLKQIDSWAIRFNYACFRQNKLNLYPAKSKIQNLGIDNSGSNTKKTRKFDTKVSNEPVHFSGGIIEDSTIKKKYAKFLSPSIFRRLVNKYKIYKYARQL